MKRFFTALRFVQNDRVLFFSHGLKIRAIRISILPNYESYRFEVQEQKVSADNGIFTFDSYFQEEEALQFVVIYDGEKILGMGFLA